MAIALIAGLVTAGAGAYSAISAGKARSDARKSAEAQQRAKADQLASLEGGLASLFAEQRDPADIYKEILLSMPGLLDAVLPDLRRQSMDTASEFTDSNVDTFKRAMRGLYGDGYDKYLGERLRILDELNPSNLGQAEILEITKKLSPLIPAGTLDPATGAVQGGTTSPVSLYRNLISGMYSERRGQYLSETKSFLTDAENAAARQQERASSFLGQFLGLAGNAAYGLAGQTLAQDQSNIAAQTALLNTILGLPDASFNSAPYDAAIGQGIQQAIGGLASSYQGARAPAYSGGASGAGMFNQSIDRSRARSAGVTPNRKAQLS